MVLKSPTPEQKDAYPINSLTAGLEESFPQAFIKFGIKSFKPLHTIESENSFDDLDKNDSIS